MDTKYFIDKIRHLIASNKMDKAIEQMKLLFENSPKLNKVLLQSARHNDIMEQIMMGVVDSRDASVTQNQIRASLLNLLSDVGLQSGQPEIKEELKHAISVVNSKNVVIGSSISAGGDVQIGDKTIHTESKMSKNLRLMLFVFVPIVVIGGTYFWYTSKESAKPLDLKVLIDNTTPNAELPEPYGEVTLTFGGTPMTRQSVGTEAMFENIPSNFKSDIFRLQYNAQGYASIDTSFKYAKSITIPVKRNSDLALIKGYVYQEGTDPLVGLENVRVSISCCSTTTDASGKFNLDIPFEHQLKKQRLELFKDGFHQKSTTEPVIAGIDIQTYLSKR
jgi:hypothetical protein